MKAAVNVRYLESVVNPETEVLKETVRKMGLTAISSVNLERTYRFTIEESSKEEAERTIKRLAEELLANKAMETYTITLEEM